MTRALARRTTTDPPEWQRNREVARLTKEILALEREASTKVVATVVEMGHRMRRIQAALEYGQWLAWVTTAVPFSPRTIQSAMRLSAWAEAEPQELKRLAKVIGGLTTRPGPRTPIGKLVQGLRHRIAGLDAVADELVRRRDEVGEEQAAALVQELRAVLEPLERAFGD